MKLIVAALWGFVMALLTFLVGPLSHVSDNGVYQAILQVVSWLILPGLVIGTMAGSFTLSVVVNFALHASLCWLLIRIFERSPKAEDVEQDEPAAR